MNQFRVLRIVFSAGLFFSAFSSPGLPAISATVTSPTPISCGGLVSGNITQTGQADLYSYSGQAGTIITLTLVDTTTQAANAFAQVSDPSGTVVGHLQAGGGQLALTLASTGAYSIQVVGGDNTDLGGYNLSVTCRNPALPSTALSCGGTVAGEITQPAQVNQYTYSGQAGGIITLTLIDTGGFSGGPAYATVFDPSGSVLLDSSNNQVAFNAGGQKQVTLPATGAYVIQIVGAAYVTTGNYNLNLACRNPLRNAAPLSCGGTASGNIQAAAQVDQYAYAGQAGGTATFTLTNTSAVNAYATLFDPSGAVVQSFTANNPPTITLAMTGTYLIQVVGAAYNATGTYTLSVLCGANLSGESFHSVAPCRIADTRTGSGFSGPFGPPSLSGGGQPRTFPIPQSACNIPDTAQAYSFNVTAVPHGHLGYLSIWPDGELQPLVSTLNSNNGQVVANAAIVPAGAQGSVDVYASDDTDVIIDINGYFVPANPADESFYPDTPCRIADTRGFGFTGPFGPPSLLADSPRDFPILSSPCNINKDAKAYSFNVTVVPPGPLSYLTLWPDGQEQPYVSTLNSDDGRVVANAAIVPAGSDGAIDVFASDNTDLIIDINGHFGPAVAPNATNLGLHFFPVSPCRVADTRAGSGFSGPFGPPSLVGGQSRDFPIPASSCGIPSTARAYSLNVTVVPPAPLGYLTAWPTGQSQPYVSTLNSLNGTVVANAALVPAGSGGSVSVYVTDNTDLVVDIDGYFAP